MTSASVGTIVILTRLLRLTTVAVSLTVVPPVLHPIEVCSDCYLCAQLSQSDYLVLEKMNPRVDRLNQALHGP